MGGTNWASVLGLRQGTGRFTGPAYKSSFNPASRTWGVGLHAYFLNPIRYQKIGKYWFHEKAIYFCLYLLNSYLYFILILKIIILNNKSIKFNFV